MISFNDLHGNVQESGKNVGIAKLASAIKERTSLNEFSNYEAIPLAAGDLYQVQQYQIYSWCSSN